MGEKVETVPDFSFFVSEIPADGDCSHEIKRHFLSWKKSYEKSRDISLLTKVHIIKAVSFPVVMYRCENWTIKKPEYWRIGAFKLWCWRRLLRVLWKQEDQLILKEIHSEYSLEGLMLKLQYFGHKMGRVDSLEKTWCWERLSLRREEGDRGWESWMASPIQWTWVWANSGR